MERSIFLMILITGCLYLVVDEIAGNKKYISRFTQNIAAKNLGEVIIGKVNPQAPIMQAPDGKTITAKEFQDAIEGAGI